MPEGHVLHRLAQQFSRDFAGQHVLVESPQGRFEAGANLVNGSKLVGARAHGKHLFLEFAGERFIHIHLGLYGKWRFHEVDGHLPAPIGQVRLRVACAGEVADLAGPNRCALVSA